MKRSQFPFVAILSDPSRQKTDPDVAQEEAFHALEVSAVQHAFGEKATGGGKGHGWPVGRSTADSGSSAGVHARTLSDPRVDVVRGRIGRTRALDDLDVVRKEVYPDKVALSVRVHDPPEIDRAHHDRVLDCTRGAVPKCDFDLGGLL